MRLTCREDFLNFASRKINFLMRLSNSLTYRKQHFIVDVENGFFFRLSFSSRAPSHNLLHFDKRKAQKEAEISRQWTWLRPLGISIWFNEKFYETFISTFLRFFTLLKIFVKVICFLQTTAELVAEHFQSLLATIKLEFHRCAFRLEAVKSARRRDTCKARIWCCFDWRSVLSMLGWIDKLKDQQNIAGKLAQRRKVFPKTHSLRRCTDWSDCIDCKADYTADCTVRCRTEESHRNFPTCTIDVESASVVDSLRRSLI